MMLNNGLPLASSLTLMGPFRVCVMTMTTTVSLTVLICLFTLGSIYCQQASPVLLNPEYFRTQASTTQLQLDLYDTRYDATTRLSCSRACTLRRSWSPPCYVFSFDQGSKTCDLYTPGSAIITDPNVFLYILPRKNTFHTVSIGDRLYSFNLVSTKMSYFEGRSYCRSQGGKLMELDTLDKYEALKTIHPYRRFANTNAWVGANDRDNEGQWVTEEDGLPIDDVTWHWRDGGKDGGVGQNCARLKMSSFRLADRRCDDKIMTMCERDA